MKKASQGLPETSVHKRRGQRETLLEYSASLKRAESIAPLLVAALGFVIIYFRFRQQVVQGPGWDPFAFLANALEFAGRGIGYNELHRPPLISFLTSLFFRAGFVQEWALFAVDGILVFLGMMGLYKLLNLRFPTWLSLLGALLFLSFPPVIGLTTTGYTDLPSVALSIWAIYFVILALERDSRYHWIAWPIFTLAGFMRFTGFLLIVPILPLLVGRASILRNLKDIAIGLSLSLLMTIPAFVLYWRIFGDPIFPFTNVFFAIAEPPPNIESFATNRSLMWFLDNMKGFVLHPSLHPLYGILSSLVVIGLFLRLAKMARRVKRDIYHNLFLLAALTLYVFIFLKANFAIRQVSLVVLGILLYHHFAKADQKSVTLDVIFLLWFMTYFDYHSHDPVKIERYFLVMAPSVAFFVLVGLESVVGAFGQRSPRAVLTAAMMSVLGIAIFLSFEFVFVGKPQKDPLVSDAIRTSQWLRNNDPQISEASIYSDLWPVFSWYLRQKVDPMPFFKDKRAFNHELEKYDIDYYLTIRDRTVPSYETKAQIGTVTVLAKNPNRLHNRTRVLYLGMNWEHYLEDVLDFKYFVVYEGGKYYLGKSVYLDGYNLEELKKYPLIVLYNFKWHGRKRAELLLREYVSSGGTVIIDTSGNNGTMPYNLEGDTFLGVSITRKALPVRPVIRISPDFPLSAPDFRPFLSDGETWYGMTYQNLDTETPFEVLATANGDTLIAKQRLGRGKVIWIGFNLLWHSFYKKGKSEQKFIKEIFDYALK